MGGSRGEKSDLELVILVREGQKWAFSELVSRHQKPLIGVIMRFLRSGVAVAEDVAQDAFIKAYQKITTFEGRSSFKSWLYQIALNTARNRFRSRESRETDIEDVSIGVVGGAEDDMLRDGVKAFIRREVALLPERQQMALTLRIFEDLSFKEISEIMGCPYDTAKANYRHGLLKIKERLESQESKTILVHFEERDFGIGRTYLRLREAES